MNNWIKFKEPKIINNRIYFYFDSNTTSLPLQKNSFFLEYPEFIDLHYLSSRDLSTLIMMLFWSFFNLLNDFDIYLPYEIRKKEMEIWARLSDLQRASLFLCNEKLKDRLWVLHSGKIKISDDRYWDKKYDGIISCLSGGKDSLLQFGLYNKFDNSRPIGVMISSPTQTMIDHISNHRNNIIKEFEAMHYSVLLVKTNLREIYDNDFPKKYGIPWNLNEIIDCQLYLSACLPIVKYYRARGIAIASEFDVQRVNKINGGNVAGEYFMYHIFCLEILNRILKMIHNINIENLILSLPHYTIQFILTYFFNDLFKLQDSCYSQKSIDTRYCSSCSKCFLTTVCLLSIGVDPSVLGINTMKVLWPKAKYWDLANSLRFAESGKNIRFAAKLINIKKVKEIVKNQSISDFVLLRAERRLSRLRNLASSCSNEDEKYASLPKIALCKFLPQHLKHPIMSFFIDVFKKTDSRPYEEITKGTEEASRYVFSNGRNE